MLNFALIGYGDRGKSHAECLSLSAKLNFYAICDKIEERAKTCADKYNVKAYTDATEMLKDNNIDVVVVVTQSPDHAPLSIEALEAGKHVLCEKPIADSLKAAKKMIETANKTGKKVAIGYQRRFMPGSQELKKAALELDPVQIMYTGQRGVFLSKYLKSGSAYGIMDSATHEIDYVNWLAGSTPVSVTGNLKRSIFTDTEAIDIVSLLIDYEKNNEVSIGSITSSMGGIGLTNICHIVGKHGNAQPGKENTIKISDIDFSEKYGEEKERQKVTPRVQEYNYGSDYKPTQALHEAFVDYIMEKGSAEEIGIATFEDGFNSLLVAEGVLASERSGEKINLETLLQENGKLEINQQS